MVLIVQNRVFAIAEFTNLNSTNKVRILFVKSEVEVHMRNPESIFHKIFDRPKKNVVGITCGVEIEKNTRRLKASSIWKPSIEQIILLWFYRSSCNRMLS